MKSLIILLTLNLLGLNTSIKLGSTKNLNYPLISRMTIKLASDVSKRELYEGITQLSLLNIKGDNYIDIVVGNLGANCQSEQLSFAPWLGGCHLLINYNTVELIRAVDVDRGASLFIYFKDSNSETDEDKVYEVHTHYSQISPADITEELVNKVVEIGEVLTRRQVHLDRFMDEVMGLGQDYVDYYNTIKALENNLLKKLRDALLIETNNYEFFEALNTVATDPTYSKKISHIKLMKPLVEGFNLINKITDDIYVHNGYRYNKLTDLLKGFPVPLGAGKAKLDEFDKKIMGLYKSMQEKPKLLALLLNLLKKTKKQPREYRNMNLVHPKPNLDEFRLRLLQTLPNGQLQPGYSQDTGSYTMNYLYLRIFQKLNEFLSTREHIFYITERPKEPEFEQIGVRMRASLDWLISNCYDEECLISDKELTTDEESRDRIIELIIYVEEESRKATSAIPINRKEKLKYYTKEFFTLFESAKPV
jgi:hypothetical protein